MKRDIFHLGVEWGIVDFKIQAISSTLRWCKFSFRVIVGSKYVFHTDNDNDVLSRKINQHICVLKFFKRGTTCTLIPYCTKGGTYALKVRNRGGYKNHKKYIYFFSHLRHPFYIQHFFIAKIYRFYKEAPAQYHICLGC